MHLPPPVPDPLQSVLDPVRGGKARAVLTAIRLVLTSVLTVFELVPAETVVKIMLVWGSLELALRVLVHTGTGDDQPPN